jgi:hypothetical protein
VVEKDMNPASLFDHCDDESLGGRMSVKETVHEDRGGEREKGESVPSVTSPLSFGQSFG